MTGQLTVRPEGPGDVAGIRSVLEAVFGEPTEANLVDALRQDPTAWLSWGSIVAADAARIVGHVLGTRMRVGGAAAVALAPLAVRPDRQRSGVGTALVEALVAAAGKRSERLIVVLGDPDYYGRFGFIPAIEHGVHGLYDGPEFQALTLVKPGAVGLAPRGEAVYPAAFRTL
ncbi:MAG: N-acetyltransferase [Sporichthyaceae bacterium]|nr:N-acetyltransferase [Sporichthyaceae bacterium]